jgi:hypothetical protein
VRAQAAAQGGTPSGAAPFTVLHANANLVLVDVVVDDRGKPVEGLKQGDFHILENGKEQAIFSFEEHGPALAAAPDADAEPATDLPAGMYTNLPVFPEQGAVNVLLVDALNTRMGDQMRVRQQMFEYLSQIKPGTTLAVFTLTSRLRMISGFTSNVAIDFAGHGKRERAAGSDQSGGSGVDRTAGGPDGAAFDCERGIGRADERADQCGRGVAAV